MTMQIKDVPENEIDTPAARLKTAREDKGLTRKKLAELTGIPAKTIEKYEYGGSEPGFTRLKSLCGALDIEVSDILKFDVHGTSKQMSNPVHDDGQKTDEDKNNAFDYISECNIHLSTLEALRETGFDQTTRKTQAHYEALKNSLCFLEYNELLELAVSRNIKVEDTVSVVAEKDYFEDEEETLQPDCEELANRIIDTAVFGVDFYSIELEALSDMAEDYDLAPDRFIWAGWRGHQEITSQIRMEFLEKEMQGQHNENFLDTERFPRK